jgi:DNA-binding response OmpR family regulator
MDRLRSIADLEMVPVVVITAREQTEGEKAVQLGARSFLSKPFRGDEVVAEVRRVLGT